MTAILVGTMAVSSARLASVPEMDAGFLPAGAPFPSSEGRRELHPLRAERAASLSVDPRSTPAARPDANRSGGLASWYCLAGRSACHHAYPSGLYAAAGPALRRGDWRGSKVEVCRGDVCVVVTLVDWCGCYAGTERERAIDLYADAFRRLAPLERGVIRVTIGGMG